MLEPGGQLHGQISGPSPACHPVKDWSGVQQDGALSASRDLRAPPHTHTPIDSHTVRKQGHCQAENAHPGGPRHCHGQPLVSQATAPTWGRPPADKSPRRPTLPESSNSRAFKACGLCMNPHLAGRGSSGLPATGQGP